MSGLIGMSCREVARFSECYDSLMNMLRPPDTRFMQCRSLHVPQNLNILGQMVLDEGYDWLFLVDDDHVFQQTTLYALLDRNVDIVGGLYLKREMPFEPIAYHEAGGGELRPHYLDASESLVEVDAIGAGCLLIRRNVLGAIAQPWWEVKSETGPPDKINTDVEFCRKAKKHGFKIYCDTDVSVAHIAVTPIVPMKRNGQWSTLLVSGMMQGINLPAAQSPLAIVTKYGA